MVKYVPLGSKNGWDGNPVALRVFFSIRHASAIHMLETRNVWRRR